jgi:hypothetical protein
VADHDHDRADDSALEKVAHQIADAGAAAGAAAGRAGAAAGRLIASAAHEVRDGEAAQLRRAAREPLANLYEVHPEARFAPRRLLGLKTIPVAEVKGTAVEGAAQRNGDFLPLPRLQGSNWLARWQRLRKAHANLVILPPIDVFQTMDGYWVIDGHNRVAAALYGGQDDIDAVVTHIHLPGEPAEPETGFLGAGLEGSQDLRAAGEGRLTPGSTVRPTEGPSRRSP